MLVPLLAALSAPAPACPTLATGETSQLSFDVAQVAIVRQGKRTTFSVSINPFGDPQEFALVMPVPEVLEEHEIRTLDGSIFARLDGATAPRHVSDAGCSPGSSGTYSDCGDTDGTVDASESGSVDVEAEYLVGGYEVVILSATEAGGLYDWLDEHGYHLPAGAEERLAEYIEAGQYFLGAQVADGAASTGGNPLAPLQVSYESDVFGIPIRLATLNSPGEQDMVIYAIVAAADGAVGISNYPEFDVPDTCIWRHDSGDFASFYEAWFTRHWEAVGDAGWTREFYGDPAYANPSSGVYLTLEDYEALGVRLDSGTALAMTRLRMRYTPKQADQDLVLYGSRDTFADVSPYADDNASNRECRHYCGTEPGELPGMGSSEGDEAPAEDGKGGCSALPGAASGLLAAVGLLGARRRRVI